MFTNARDATRFALAGNATLTVFSRRTGARYTLRIAAPKMTTDGEPVDASPRRFVSLLSGPDNESDHTYLGMIFDAREPRFTLTQRSRMHGNSPPVLAAKYLCSRVFSNTDAPLPPDLEIRHAGRCGRCNRKLTVPSSVDQGLDPECAGKV